MFFLGGMLLVLATASIFLPNAHSIESRDSQPYRFQVCVSRKYSSSTLVTCSLQTVARVLLMRGSEYNFKTAGGGLRGRRRGDRMKFQVDFGALVRERVRDEGVF